MSFADFLSSRTRQAGTVAAILLGAALIGWPPAGFAQSNTSIDTSRAVRPVSTLPLRETPPEGLLGAKGNVVGEVIAGHSYDILGQKIISTVLGQQMWLNVRDVESKQTGWVYSGSDDRPYQNVIQQKE